MFLFDPASSDIPPLVSTVVQRITELIIIHLTNKPTYSIFAASHMYTLSKGNLQSEYPPQGFLSTKNYP
jgi:hypothetical protein